MCLHQFVSEVITDIFTFGLFTVVFFSLFSWFLLVFFFFFELLRVHHAFTMSLFFGLCLRTRHRCLFCFAQKQYLVISRAMYKYATQVPSVLLLKIHPWVLTCPLSTAKLILKNLNIIYYVYWNDCRFCCPSLIPEVAKFLPRVMSTVWKTSLSSSGRAGTWEKSLSSLCLRILILSSFLEVLFMTLRVMSCPFCPFST